MYYTLKNFDGWKKKKLKKVEARECLVGDWNNWCPIELNGQNIRLNHFECLVVFMLMFPASKARERIFDGDI